MSQDILVHTLPNGLTILAERLPGVRSAAMNLVVPAGGCFDPVGRSGTATVLSELVMRGAGNRDSRALTDHLDRLGLQRANASGTTHMRFTCAALAEQVSAGLGAYSDVVQRAHLPDEGFEPARDLALQCLAGVADEPREVLMINLKKLAWPWPYGRSALGETDELEALTLADVQEAYRNHVVPRDAIFSIAGDIVFDDIVERVTRLFGDWSTPATTPTIEPGKETTTAFQEASSEQTHIGLSYPSVTEMHPDYYAARISVEVLSGGMSGRLFTEIREKKGLVYSVSAGYSNLRDYATVMGYAGTSNDRAQQTLDQFVIELRRLSDGVTLQELDRAKIGLKASIIMSGESTSARSSALAHDFIMRGRVRTIEEIISAIDNTDLDTVNRYVAENRAENFKLAIVGPKNLELR